MIIETFHTVVAGLIQIILVLPARVGLGDAVQEGLGPDDMEIFSAQGDTLRSDTGHFCLRIFQIVCHIHIGVGAQLQLPLLLQLMVSRRRNRVRDLRAGVGDGGKAAPQRVILPCEDILFSLFQGDGKLRRDFKHGAFTDVAVRLPVFIHVYLVIAVFLCISRVDAEHLQRLRI